MGKIKNLLLNKINIMLGAVLSMLGWSGCNEVFNSEDLYGCPYSYYQLEGAVLDDEEKPIGNIRVATKWIFSADDNFNKIQAIMGSSNLTYSGLTNQGELNAEFGDSDSAEKLSRWFNDRKADSLWLDNSGFRLVPDPQGRQMRIITFNRHKGKI